MMTNCRNWVPREDPIIDMPGLKLIMLLAAETDLYLYLYPYLLWGACTHFHMITYLHIVTFSVSTW